MGQLLHSNLLAADDVHALLSGNVHLAAAEVVSLAIGVSVDAVDSCGQVGVNGIAVDEELHLLCDFRILVLDEGAEALECRRTDALVEFAAADEVVACSNGNHARPSC